MVSEDVLFAICIIFIVLVVIGTILDGQWAL